MANSVHKDFQGPDWPLGSIVVTVPGTPVGIMSLVDPIGINDPSTVTPAAGAAAQTSAEYTQRAHQIIFQAVKAGVSHGTTQNAGNVYIVRKPVGAGSGNRDDLGSIVKTLIPGEVFFLSSAPSVRDVFSPYRYSIDADNANDACTVTLLIF